MVTRIIKWVLVKLNIDLYLKTPDRAMLEGTILPWLSARPSTDRVLFVGCSYYTRGCRKWFKPAGYWTLDIDPSKKLFGAGDLHITDSMVNLSRYFAAGSLDLVICNGVFGWGLDERQDIETAFAAVARALRPGGLFLPGWNDVPEHRPVAPDSTQALTEFQAAVIAPLQVSQMLVPGSLRHTFNLFVKL